MRGRAEAGRDFLRAPTAIFRKLAEALELVGGVQVLAVDVLVKADFRRIVRRVDNAADRLGFPWCFFCAGLIAWTRRFVGPVMWKVINFGCAAGLAYFAVLITWRTLAA